MLWGGGGGGGVEDDWWGEVVEAMKLRSSESQRQAGMGYGGGKEYPKASAFLVRDRNIRAEALSMARTE